MPNRVDETSTKRVQLRDTALTQKVTGKKLQALLRASDDMVDSIFRRDPVDTLKTVVTNVRSLLNAESCGLFLVSEESPQDLVREANSSDKHQLDFKHYRVKLNQKSMTSFLAQQGKIVNLRGPRLSRHPLAALYRREHLILGRYTSILAIPLKDRKGRMLGLVKVDNKKGVDGRPHDTVFFDAVDESIARILANTIVIVLESRRRFDAFRGLMSAIQIARSLEDILNDILHKGLALLHANRGDLAWWDDNKDQLVLGATVGESTLTVGQALPEHSIMRSVWRTRKSRLEPDVSSAPDYLEANPGIKSEIAVPLKFDGKVVGVLNAESFQLRHFDEPDLELLDHLARYATIAARVVGREADVTRVVQRLAEPSPTREEVLTTILKGVQGSHGFGAGIIYFADYNERVLRCLATIGCEGARIPAEEFEFKFKARALATHVFREKAAYFSAAPKRDRIVSKRGIRVFDIHGPVAGVPLLFRDSAVGVLVVWGQKGEPTPEERHKELLEPFARLAATTIAISETERRRGVVLQDVQKILASLQKMQFREVQSRESIIQLVLNGIRSAGFDRARAYKFDPRAQAFIGSESSGMGSMPFRGFQVTLNDPYAQLMADRGPFDPTAQVRDPSGPLGPNRFARALRMPPDLPWAVVPLVTSGKLYGLLAADNAVTRREITKDSLDYMTLVGALAAQAIANAETIKMQQDSKVKDDLLRKYDPKLAAKVAEKMAEIGQFDVFLSYNSKDRIRAMKFARRLRRRGVVPWLDVEQMKPGDVWIDVLEKVLDSVRCTLVLISRTKYGPWQRIEVKKVLYSAVKRKGRLVIPVILQGAERKVKIHGFLGLIQEVDLRHGRRDPFNRLILRIEREKPRPRL